EHLAVRRRSRRHQVTPRAQDCELDGAPPRLRLPFFRAELRAQLLGALCFRLLILDILAFESASHDPVYSIQMLDVVDKRARLHGSLRYAAGPLTEQFKVNIEPAARAAAGLWRHDASVWNADPATQKKVADRLGWL